VTKPSMHDLGIMPIHFQFTMGDEEGRDLRPRRQYTLAFQFKQVKG
jgi:hypothetical protein